MQLNFVGKNFDITPALKTFTTEKFKSLEKRYNHITTVHVILHVENITHIAEATVHINGTEIHANAKEDDMYKAVEALVDKLLGQITKYKDKIIDHHR